MDRKNVGQAFMKGSQLFERFLSLQTTAVALMSNFGNLNQRLPELENLSNYSGLPMHDELQRLVIVKQTKSLETVLQRLHTTMSELEDVVRGQERVCTEMASLIGQATVVGDAAALIPGCAASPDQLLESLQDVWYMCRDELCLKHAVISKVSLAMEQQVFGELQALFTECIHIDLTRQAALLVLNPAEILGT
mmetsp:Transcript_30981/g.68672  ORF Transcript_30981/g.68672 Transcript_30981/m.68672 type:complete len:193 (+) Transcript_30981:123-701(+)|eukprot:CAMPEP_0202911204 /NCGR_PEP_ID=MMETSP1392-20130828/54319_1 /ASSEMBLY_ACC=CAM_ASM_000868 /TAXON_ID=225041 /ORGANISM="Chlamydomonas chlamydogama, Strain SAG 11-48b" /LENGTH=192 /DNA_ID=CAMNT_0049601615 /DNA_START=67 /DNA_END=645 /DNA_ORIENTATION=+